MRHKIVWTVFCLFFSFRPIGGNSLIVLLRDRKNRRRPSKPTEPKKVRREFFVTQIVQFSNVENVWQRFFRMRWRCMRWTRTAAQIPYATTTAATLYARSERCSWNNSRMLRGWTLRFGCVCCHSGKFIAQFFFLFVVKYQIHFSAQMFNLSNTNHTYTFKFDCYPSWNVVKNWTATWNLVQNRNSIENKCENVRLNITMKALFKYLPSLIQTICDNVIVILPSAQRKNRIDRREKKINHIEPMMALCKYDIEKLVRSSGLNGILLWTIIKIQISSF